jgi:hypothetical protein
MRKPFFSCCFHYALRKPFSSAHRTIRIFTTNPHNNCKQSLFANPATENKIFNINTMKSFALATAFLAASASAAVPSLTPDNYDELTAGKTVFIKFFAPWVGRSR